MKRSLASIVERPGKSLWLASLVASLALAGAGCGGGGADESASPPKRAAAAADTAVEEEPVTNDVAGVTPVFKDVPGEGVDPFFPDTERRQKVEEVAQDDGGPAVSGGVVTNLVVKTIIPAATPRAWINNRSFVVGDEAEVKLPNGEKVILECLDIGAEAVIVNIKDLQGRMVRERAQLPLQLRRQ